MASNKQEEAIVLEGAHQQAIAEDEAKGAKVYSFDPDASTEQKASAALRAAQDKLAPMKGVAGTGAGLVQGLTNAIPTPFNIPSINVEDSDEIEAEKSGVPDQKLQTPVEDAAAPPDAKPRVIPETVGWRNLSGIDKPPLPEGEEKDLSILQQFLSEQFYAAWYNNAGIIVFAVVASHLMTWLGFGWGWLILILIACHTYYTTNVRRFEREARDDMVREMVKTKLGEHNPESVEWMNGFLERFWVIYEPVLSATILASVDQILSISTPPFLDSLGLSDFSLGNKAPRIDKIWTMIQEDDDVVQMDWSLSFTPTDVMDMTKRQADKKLNPKVVLSIRLGKGLATASLPVLVEDISLTGRIRIRLQLSDTFPYVHILDFCFTEKPVIDYALKPLGGDTFGLDIANIPGLSSFIRDTTHSVLGPMMYHPNMYRLNLEQMLSGQPVETAIGVLEVMVHSARNVRGGTLGDGTPDPFIALAIDEKPELARTKWRNNTHNPTWMEVKYLLVNKLEGNLNLHLYDHNERRQNNKISTATFDLGLLKDDSVQEGIVTKLIERGKDHGELRYDVSFYPALDPNAVSAAANNDSSIGIVRLIVHQAKELDTTHSTSGEINPLAKVYFNHSPKASFTTATYKRTNKPIWEAPHEFLCSSKDTDVLTIKVINDRDFRKNPTIGYMSVRVKDLLAAKEQGKDWYNLSRCKSGKIRVSATWKPVAMSGSLHGAGHYVPPIGVVRLRIDKATNVKNVDTLGKSDPYIRVQVRNETKGKTRVIDDNLNPVWDEIFYVPVHSLRESIMLDCMDEEKMSKDRPLGSVELHVSDIAKKSDDPRLPYESTGPKAGADVLRLDKGDTKGILYYEAIFIPGWQVDVKFHKGAAGKVTERDDEDGGNVSDSSTSSYASTAEVPLTFKAKKATLPKVDTSTADEAQADVLSPVSAAPSPTETVNSVIVAPRAQYSAEELLAQQSGIVVFNVVSGQLSGKGRIEVVLDDLEWPCVSTPKSRSKTARWEFVGEGFVKEIDFGQVHLFLDEANEEGKDRVVSEWSGPIKDFLRDTLDGPKEYILTDKNGKEPSQVMIEARYIPVPVVLEPRESVNNQGTLRVELVDGQDMRAVDRGGTRSDPYAVFTLNGSKVFKSEPHKKTVTPEWNEDFEVSIPSRAAADFQVEVFDWNRVEQDESLGVGSINLQNLEAFKLTERWVTLSTPKYGEKGRIRVRLLFKPMIIAKTRKTASTFTSVPGRAMTQIGALPVQAGKGVAHSVTGLFKRD